MAEKSLIKTDVLDKLLAQLPEDSSEARNIRANLKVA